MERRRWGIQRSSAEHREYSRSSKSRASGGDLEIIPPSLALKAWNPRGKTLYRDHISYSSYCQETYSVSQEGREVVLERDGGHLFD